MKEVEEEGNHLGREGGIIYRKEVEKHIYWIHFSLIASIECRNTKKALQFIAECNAVPRVLFNNRFYFTFHVPEKVSSIFTCYFHKMLKNNHVLSYIVLLSPKWNLLPPCDIKSKRTTKTKF